MAYHPSSGPAWGDEMLRKENALVGKKEESPPDAEGVRTLTEYVRNPETGAVEKITKRVKRVTRTVRVSPSVSERTTWSPFGRAVEGNDGTVAVSYDEIHFEKAAGEEKPKDELDKLLDAGSALIVCRHCGKVGDHYTLKCPYKGINLGGGTPTGAMPPAEGGPEGGEDKTGKYVPPSMLRRQAAGGGATAAEVPVEELTSLRVSNLSEDVEEDELRGLFSHYGRIHRLHLARDRETNMPKGFAFISYYDHGEAEAALKALHGYPFQHLVLRVEWSKPREKDAMMSGGLAGSAFVSGYGKALPQSRGK